MVGEAEVVARRVDRVEEGKVSPPFFMLFEFFGFSDFVFYFMILILPGAPTGG